MSRRPWTDRGYYRRDELLPYDVDPPEFIKLSPVRLFFEPEIMNTCSIREVINICSDVHEKLKQVVREHAQWVTLNRGQS